MSLISWLKNLQQNFQQQPNNSRHRGRPHWRARRTRVDQVVQYLEERVMLAAAYSADTADVAFDRALTGDAADAGNPVQTAIGTTTITVQLNQSQDVVAGSVAGRVVSFIDAGLTDYQSIVRAITGEDDATLPGSGSNEVVLLDPRRDGIQQITETLSGRSEISAIRIFSHGTSGALLLGSGKVDAAGLQSLADQFASWSQSLSDDADILLYGCDVGAGQRGGDFIAELATLTKADVAASSNSTGNISWWRLGTGEINRTDRPVAAACCRALVGWAAPESHVQ